jgi:hypothetical protein
VCGGGGALVRWQHGIDGYIMGQACCLIFMVTLECKRSSVCTCPCLEPVLETEATVLLLLLLLPPPTGGEQPG